MITDALLRFNPNLDQWNLTDFLFLFVLIPVLLIDIHLLPADIINTYFALHPCSWDVTSFSSWTSLFLSNYTHITADHLASVIITYYILMFCIVNVETDKTFFYKIFFGFLLILPFVVSFCTLHVLPYSERCVGASGVFSALIGYFVFQFYRYLKHIYNVSFGFVYFVLLLVLNVMWINIAFNKNLLVSVGITLTCFSIILVCLLSLRPKISMFQEYVKPRRGRIIPIGRVIYWIFIVSSFVYFYIGFIFLIRAPGGLPTGVGVNICGHAVGYVYGIVFPLLSAIVGKEL